MADRLGTLIEKFARLEGKLEATLPHLATKEEVREIVSKALSNKKGGLSTKQIGLIVGAGIALATAITGFLAAGCMPL